MSVVDMAKLINASYDMAASDLSATSGHVVSLHSLTVLLIRYRLQATGVYIQLTAAECHATSVADMQVKSLSRSKCNCEHCLNCTGQLR